MLNFTEKEEKERISWWKKKLGSCSTGWEVGDKKGHHAKTADIINHSRKIAVELKREKGGSLDNQNGNLITLSNRLESRIEDANEKFKQYPGYQTILIIELETDVISAQVVMSGLSQIHFKNGNRIGQSIKNKKLYCGMKQIYRDIGAIVLWPSSGNIFHGVQFYFNNPSAKTDRKILIDEAEKIICGKLKPLNFLS